MATANLFDTNPTPTPQANLIAIRAAIMAAAAKVAAGELVRDDLEAGSQTEVKLTIRATVGDVEFSQDYSAGVNVNHDSIRASSVGPNQDELLGYVLSKLNLKTREAVIRACLDEYGRLGELPDTPGELTEVAKDFRAALRQKKSQAVRGSVKVDYSATAPVRLADIG